MTNKPVKKLLDR